MLAASFAGFQFRSEDLGNSQSKIYCRLKILLVVRATSSGGFLVLTVNKIAYICIVNEHNMTVTDGPQYVDKTPKCRRQSFVKSRARCCLHW